MRLANHGKTHTMTGTGLGLAHEVVVDGNFGMIWNRTDLFLGSKTGPLAGIPDPLLTLITCLDFWSQVFHYSVHKHFG